MKNILITGGSSGIGLAAAEQLLEKGHRIIIAARGEDKLKAAVSDLKKKRTTSDISYMTVDLADFDDVVSFANKVKAEMPVIDVLALNAGLYSGGKYQFGKSGYEMMISATHLGHFLLTKLLLENVKASKAGRIIVTSSEAHRVGFLDVESFTEPRYANIPYIGPILGYGQSKLANILFTRELARQLNGTSVTVNCFHPGAVATGFSRYVPSVLETISKPFLITAEKGARTLVYLAESEQAAKFSGKYFVAEKLRRPTQKSRDRELAKLLWEESEKIVSKYV